MLMPPFIKESVVFARGGCELVATGAGTWATGTTGEVVGVPVGAGLVSVADWVPLDAGGAGVVVSAQIPGMGMNESSNREIQNQLID